MISQEEHIIIHEIVDSLVNGQFKQAKEQTLDRCKTKPEVVARRTGLVVSHLYTRLALGCNLVGSYLDSFK